MSAFRGSTVLACEDEDEDGEETDGGTSVVELKKGRSLSQAIGTAILIYTQS